MNDILTRGGALPSFDPQRPGLLAEPYRVFDEYRSRDPVHWSGGPSGRRGGRWYVFDFRSAATVLADKRFCRQPVAAKGTCPVSASAAVSGCARTEKAPAAPLLPGAFPAMVANWLLFQDPPRHTRMRSVVSPNFTLAAAQLLRPRIEERARELLESLAALERFDLMQEFAFPLPLDLIADVLGVDATERATFRRWSSAIREALDRPKWGTDALERAEAATVGLRDYFEAAWRRHGTKADQGVLDALFCLEGQEPGLSKEEAFATFTFLISAGHETTTNLLGSGMYLLSQHPQESRRLQAEPELIGKAIEEILRFESPVQMAARNVAEEVQLGSKRLLPGQRVEVMLGAANRDPAVFAAPERFDVARKPNPHLAFGVGSHYCVGASLGRLIGAVSLPLLLERVQVQPFSGEASPWSTSIGFRGLKHLSCSWRGARGPESDRPS